MLSEEKKNIKQETKTFISGSGCIVATKDKGEIKKLKACGWKEMRKPKTHFTKGLQHDNNFYA